MQRIVSRILVDFEETRQVWEMSISGANISPQIFGEKTLEEKTTSSSDDIKSEIEMKKKYMKLPFDILKTLLSPVFMLLLQYLKTLHNLSVVSTLP